jgi:quercetin dioxygenase-like cupin family protein
MWTRRLSFLTLALLGVFSFCLAQEKMGGMQHDKHVMLSPDEMKWGPAPPALPPGAQIALLQGDPSKAGASFTVRVKFPDGYKVPPHWHPSDENVTVIQGTLWMGVGDKHDTASAREMPAGSFMLMPKGTRHFAQAKGETIVNITSTGPFEVNYVNPADDPRLKK